MSDAQRAPSKNDVERAASGSHKSDISYRTPPSSPIHPQVGSRDIAKSRGRCEAFKSRRSVPGRASLAKQDKEKKLVPGRADLRTRRRGRDVSRGVSRDSVYIVLCEDREDFSPVRLSPSTSPVGQIYGVFYGEQEVQQEEEEEDVEERRPRP